MTSRRIYGVDFTSRPTAAKPISCVEAELADGVLSVSGLEAWASFDAFEAFLERPGPWVAGFDFPFGQARRFIENIGWPQSWEGYVRHVAGMSRHAFREALDGYRQGRPAGDREHRRVTDAMTGAVSSQKLYGVPVALMFFEGAPRLLQSGLDIPLLRPTGDARHALEAYPGKLARDLVGRRPYKQDTRQKQTAGQRQARRDLLAGLREDALGCGIRVVAPDSIVDDPKGDTLDALLCAVQAAVACRRDRFGIPSSADPLEGWIVDAGGEVRD